MSALAHVILLNQASTIKLLRSCTERLPAFMDDAAEAAGLPIRVQLLRSVHTMTMALEGVNKQEKRGAYAQVVFEEALRRLQGSTPPTDVQTDPILSLLPSLLLRILDSPGEPWPLSQVVSVAIGLAGKVEAVCKKYNIPYNTGSFGQQYWTVVKRVIKYSFLTKEEQQLTTNS